MVSLVHVWLAAVLLVATALGMRHQPGALRKLGLIRLLPATAGILIASALLYTCCGLNVMAAALATARSQAEVTRGANAMPLLWQLLGVPLFSLFVGPAFWSAGCWLARTALRVPPAPDGEPARFGRYLLIGSAVIMVATVGFTNAETPRLWIPFVPLLLLGAAQHLRVFVETSPGNRRLLVMLVFLHVTISLMQWSLMDMREAEERLVSKRFFW